MKRLYLGIRAGTARFQEKAEAFRYEGHPTKQSHPQYKAVIGPFQTKAALNLMKDTHPNPHIQCVADAERIVRQMKRKAQEPKRLHCDSCVMITINGIKCHETGCPKMYLDEKRECQWCGTEYTPKTRFQTTCCDDCYISLTH